MLKWDGERDISSFALLSFPLCHTPAQKLGRGQHFPLTMSFKAVDFSVCQKNVWLQKVQFMCACHLIAVLLSPKQDFSSSSSSTSSLFPTQITCVFLSLSLSLSLALFVLFIFIDKRKEKLCFHIEIFMTSQAPSVVP